MLGTIADDYTGGTDVAVALRRAGLRTIIFFGLPPDDSVVLPPHDAVVIALKSRTNPAAEAVEQSTAALHWLQRHAATQVYFKFCSTFDSTADGNIGPVLDALSAQLGARSVVLTPSSPEHGRTQHGGDLFVGEVPLSQSSMRHHPLTPMRDSHLPRLLAAQTAESVDLIDLAIVRRGDLALAAEIDRLETSGRRYLLVDAVTADDLATIGRVTHGSSLLAGAAGLAGAVATARRAELAQVTTLDESFDDVPAAVLAGSCSSRTLEQVAFMIGAGAPAHRMDVLSSQDPTALAARALDWFDALPDSRVPLVYSSVPAAQLAEIHRAVGVDRASHILETATGLVARGLVQRGVRRLVSAGGETSGAVVNALGVSSGLIGTEAATGVPWIHTTGQPELTLLLKSGNFGDPDLLVRATTLPATAGAA